ncbi:hypothetical protein H8E06_00825 [bacterium]|nr:hypothetical protein [bacterium]
MKFDDKFNSITEAYLKIPGKRLMYPRGLQLSEEFKEAYKAEVIRLAEAGQCPDKLCEKVNKALMIHYTEHTEHLREVAITAVTRLAAAKAASEMASDDSEEEVDEGAGKKKYSGG